MSKEFTEYPEITEDYLEKNVEEEKDVDFGKKLKKRLKKQKKQLKKQQDELRQLQEQNRTESSNTKSKSFFEKVGDAAIKALPGILATVASTIIGSYFKPKR